MIRLVSSFLFVSKNDFFDSGLIDILLVLAYQMFYILLTFSLFLMVNRNLLSEMEQDIAGRKQVEAVLSERERLFRAIFDQAGVGVAQVDSNSWMMVRVNQKYCDITGYSSEEMVRLSVRDLTHPEDIKKNLDQVQRMIRGEIRGFSMEKRYIRKDGAVTWVYLTVSPMWSPGETPTTHVAVVEDITERKQAEQELRESEERLAAVMEGSQLGYSDWNILTGEIRRNERWANMLGYSLQEIGDTFQKWDELIHSEDRERARQSVQDHLDGKTPIHRDEYRMRAKDGTYRWILDQGKVIERGQNGNPLRMTATHTDITDRKLAEDELREITAELETIIQVSPLAIIMIDLDGIVRLWNTSAEKIFGWTADEIVGLPNPIIPSSKINEYAALGSQVLRGEILNSFETLRLHKDGFLIDVSISSAPLFDSRNSLIGRMAIIADITERKKSEYSMQKQYMYLSALQETTLELISEFDLNTLLENIVRRAGSLVGTNSGFLDLVDFETNQLKPRIGMGLLSESLVHPAAPGEGVAGKVWQTGKSLVVNDYDNWPGRIRTFSVNKLGSTIGVPLLSGGKVLGVLGLAYEIHSNKSFSKETVDILTQFARLVTIAIENTRLFASAQQELAERKAAELKLTQANQMLENQLDEIRQLESTLKELSVRDPLTGTYNRRYLEEAIKQEFARAEREAQPVSIVILDLDYLKDLNSKYGHIAGGDEALKVLSRHLISMSRAGDIVCRYGGDEFLVILHNTSSAVAFHRAEEWRKFISTLKIQYRDVSFNITFSAGVSAFPEHGKNVEDTLLAADSALYQAKESGRNCVRMMGT
jgi:diguanylate cyclase (GGDEF)-like protein/PAS domain S-box-containing protein